MRGRAPLLGALLLLGGVSCAIVRAGEGGFLADLLGERLKTGLGLISGDFVEFSLRRVRMRNVKMVAPNVKPTDEHVFLRVREVAVDFTPMEVLWKGSVRRVEIDGPEVWLGEIAAGGSDTSSGAGRQLSIGELVVKDITLHVDNLTDRGPSVLLRFATDQPLVVPDVRLGDLASNPQAGVAQELRSHSVLVSSGFGPMAPLGSVETVVVRFSWNGLAAGHVAGLELVQPVLFVGQDWFDLIGELQATDPKPLSEPGDVVGATEAAVDKTDRAMALDQLRIDGLKLALTSFGIVDVTLPFVFDYAASNVVLDTSGDFLLESTLSVRRTNWALPAQHLFVEGLQGELSFNLPPDGDRDNVVPTFTAERLTWQNVRATEPWASFTIMPSPPDSEDQAKAATAVAAVDVKFGAQLGASYLKGWLGSNLAFEWQATIDVWRTGTGPAEPFARLGLPKVAGLYAKASGTSTEVHDGQMTLVSNDKAEVVLEAGGDISAFVWENLGVAPSPEELERAAIAQVATQQRLRWGQIQDLKNQRLVGETNDGFLVARVPDLDAQWPGASKLVEDENADRLRIYQFVAKHDRKPLPDVQRAYAERWRLLAFPGEWVQTPDGAWHQK